MNFGATQWAVAVYVTVPVHEPPGIHFEYQLILPNTNSQWVIWEWKINANIYTSECFNSEHLYWISQGISNVLFDCWLTDGDFIMDCITHNKLINGLTAELEIL